jgi:putative oxidoreductase
MTNSTYHSTGNHQYGAAMLRVTLGSLMLSHGLLKLFVFTVPGTVAYFGSIGLPPIAAYLTMFGEIAGGLGLLAGVLTRLAAALSIPLLLGATWAHSANGWVFSSNGGGWEFPAFLVATALVVVVQGGGAYSLGRVLPRYIGLPKLSFA